MDKKRVSAETIVRAPVGGRPVVGIIEGSDSDSTVMYEAVDVLEVLGIPHEFIIASAHRTPERLDAYAKNAKRRGIKIIIAGAGGAAALPGDVAARCSLPVIGVPIESKSLKGLDSLLSIAQMPPGVSVACMPINGAKNAALHAAAILALTNKRLELRLEAWRKRQTDSVPPKPTPRPKGEKS